MYRVTMRRSPIEGQLAVGVGVAQEAELVGAKGLYAESVARGHLAPSPRHGRRPPLPIPTTVRTKTIEVTKNFLTE
jgi:hypothetical protein